MNNLICVNRNLCMSKNYFFMLLLIFIGMTIYYIYITKKKAESEINEYKKMLNNSTNQKVDENNNRTNIINNLPVRKLLEYRDRSILYDQLVALERRVDMGQILQLFGRPTFPGSNQYEYYVTTESNGFANKIPIETKGKKEIDDGALVKIPIFDENKGDFKVKLYNYDTPRYNPFIY